MQYIRQLDSIRAIALFLVLFWHWLPRKSIVNWLPTGPFGLTMFFVLSGFLITMILLDGKNKVEQGIVDRKNVLKTFISRRVLRIFPIYYLLVIPPALYAIYTDAPVSRFKYFLTYTSNFYYYFKGFFREDFSHLWSLAVEEQFYLMWPLIILFARLKHLLFWIAGFIIVGQTSQFLLQHQPMGEVLTFTCFDSLGMGALLAWIRTYRRELLGRFVIVTGILALAALSFMIFQYLPPYTPGVPFRFIASPIALFIIAQIVHIHHKGVRMFAPLAFILNNPILVYLGKISYGMYLYHMFVAYLTRMYVDSNPHLPNLIRDNLVTSMFLLRFALLVVISIVSWHLIEKPILKLKKYFQYNFPPKKRMEVSLSNYEHGVQASATPQSDVK